MIRKAIIVACLLLAMAVLVAGAASYRVSMGYLFGKASNPPVYLFQCIRGVFDVYQMTTASKPVNRYNILVNEEFFSRSTMLGYHHHQYAALVPDRLLAYTIYTSPGGISRLPKGSYIANADMISIRMGFWMLFALFLVYPTVVLVRHPYRRRRYRLKMGLCLECGYNLTGNVSGICSECGKKI